MFFVTEDSYAPENRSVVVVSDKVAYLVDGLNYVKIAECDKGGWWWFAGTGINTTRYGFSLVPNDEVWEVAEFYAIMPDGDKQLS